MPAQNSFAVVRFVAVVIGAIFAAVRTPAIADPWFGGFDCAGDCSEHASGYEWAEQRDIYNPDDCPQTYSQSFVEGCQLRALKPLRGSDRDDAGQFIIKHGQWIAPAPPTADHVP